MSRRHRTAHRHDDTGHGHGHGSAPPDHTGGRGNAAALEEMARAHGGGHGSGHGGGHHGMHGVHRAVETVEGLHTLGEMAEAAHTGATLAHHGHEAAEVLTGAGPASGATAGLTTAGAVLAPVTIGLGAMEMAEGVESGDGVAVAHGLTGVVSGGATATSLVAGGMGSAGVAGAAATVAPVAAAAGGGLAAGRAMDEAARESGAVTRTDTVAGRGLDGGTHTEERSLGMSDWLTEQMEDVRSATGSDVLAGLAGIAMLPGVPVAWALDALTDGRSSGHAR